MAEFLPSPILPLATNTTTTVVNDTGSGVTLSANPLASGSYTLVWPIVNGIGALTNDGAGSLTWVIPGGGGGGVQNINVNDSSASSKFTITQSGSGNSNLLFSDPTNNWSVGDDQLDGSKFKITHANVLGGVSGTADVFTISPSGVITMGNPSTPNSIFLNGGIEYQYSAYPTYPPALPNTLSGSNLVLTQNHYFIDIQNASYTGVLLPLAIANSGRKYIVVRGFATNGADFNITTQGIDTIENGPDTTINIPILGGKVSVMSDGVSRWLLV